MTLDSKDSKPKRLAVGAASAACLLVMLLFGIEVVSPMPDNALLFVDLKSKVYYSPPLVASDERKLLVVYRNALCAMEANGGAVAGGWVPDDLETPVYLHVREERMYARPPLGWTVLEESSKRDLKARGLWSQEWKPDDVHRNESGFFDENGVESLIRSWVFPKTKRWSESGDWRY